MTTGRITKSAVTHIIVKSSKHITERLYIIVVPTTICCTNATKDSVMGGSKLPSDMFFRNNN